jgi:uncharacterized membrane protein
LAAHEGHQDEAAVPAQAADLALDAHQAGQAVALDFKAMALSHLHNKIVHFPVALGLAGALFIFLSYGFKSLVPGMRLMLTLGALAAVAAVWTGGLQAREFLGGPYKAILETHALLGKISMFLLVFTAAVSWFEGLRKWLWIPALALMVVISAAGFYGGILATS